MTIFGYSRINITNITRISSFAVTSTEPEVIQKFYDELAKVIHPSWLKVSKSNLSGKSYSIYFENQNKNEGGVTSISDYFYWAVSWLCQDGWEPFSTEYDGGFHSIEFRKQINKSSSEA